MAADERMLRETAEDAAARFHVYRFRGPSVTAGRNAKVSAEMIAEWAELGHEFARRPTGGGILRHERDISFGVSFPTVDAFPNVFYLRVAEAIRLALSEQGIETALPDYCKDGSAVPTHCFEAAVGPELLYRGEKILGLASRKVARAVLVQGSLSVLRDAEADCKILGVGAKVDLSEERFDEERFADDFRRNVLEVDVQ